MPKGKVRSPSLTSQESYKAVIISDLVAEFPVAEEPQNGDAPKVEGNSFRSLNSFASDTNSKRPNGSNISQGVILNAMQFGVSDPKSDKSVQLTNALSAPVVQEKPVIQTLEEMSVMRKIAFALSFLPSVMFVLCFAIILPCIPPEACIKTVWTQTFNGSTATSSAQVLSSIVITLTKKNEHLLVALDSQNGKEIWRKSLSAKPTQLLCERIVNGEEIECIVSDEAGKIHLFNANNGSLLWTSASDEALSHPVFVPDCSHQGKVVVAAASNGWMKVISKGNAISNFHISNCDSRASSLIAWLRGNGTDLIHVCKNGSKDVLTQITQNKWCPTGVESDDPNWIINLELEPGYLIQPLEDEFLLWSGSEVSMISSNGLLKWKANTNLHLNQNRFIFTGKYKGNEHQIALLSSDAASKMQITLLNITNGKTTDSMSINGTEAREVFQLNGEKGDFFLVSSDTRQKEAANGNSYYVGAVPTTILTFLAEEVSTEFPTDTYFGKQVDQELAFIGFFDETRRTIQVMEGVYPQVTIKAFSEKNGLNIMVLRSSGESSASKTTEVRCIKVAEWDFSSPKPSECLAK